MRLVRPARALATTPRRWRSNSRQLDFGRSGDAGRRCFEFFSDDEFPAAISCCNSRGPSGLSSARTVGDGTVGGEARRVKLATELQRAQRGRTLYVLDEPTTGLHPSDVEKLMEQLGGLVEAGNTVLVVEPDMSVAAESDWVIDVARGPAARAARSSHRAVPQGGRGRLPEPHRVGISRNVSATTTRP